MSKRICIFVDGENFRHSIVDLFDDFNQSDYLPHQAEWTMFFDWLVEQLNVGGQRIRTYWYVIDAIDYYPYKYPAPDSEPNQLKSLLCKDQRYKNKLAALINEPLIQEMKKIIAELRNKQRFMTQRCNGWAALHDGISTKHNAIEFRRAGSIQYNLFTEELGTEKAVDVKLATDLIVLKDIYDIAIIVSGDQDYVPAVQVVKDFGKHVVNVSFETRAGKLLPGQRGD